MSGGWEIGDRALCVSEENRPGGLATGWSAEVGKIYTVSFVAEFVFGGVALDLAEDTDFAPEAGWDATNFRRIKPDAEPCEAEFTTLIKRMKPAKVTL
jgi:hypothetical protein